MAARWPQLGPSANGGREVPHHSPSMSTGEIPAAESAPSAACQARVSVSSSGPHTAMTARPPLRPHAAPMSAAASRHDGTPTPTETTVTCPTSTIRTTYRPDTDVR